MDYSLKVRIEIGPGVPSQLSRLETPDARKATLEAVVEMLTMGWIPAGYIGKATQGSTTACLALSRARVFSDPATSVPCTHVQEYEFAVELEDPEEARLRTRSAS